MNVSSSLDAVYNNYCNLILVPVLLQLVRRVCTLARERLDSLCTECICDVVGALVPYISMIL